MGNRMLSKDPGLIEGRGVRVLVAGDNVSLQHTEPNTSKETERI